MLSRRSSQASQTTIGKFFSYGTLGDCIVISKMLILNLQEYDIEYFFLTNEEADEENKRLSNRQMKRTSDCLPIIQRQP